MKYKISKMFYFKDQDVIHFDHPLLWLHIKVNYYFQWFLKPKRQTFFRGNGFGVNHSFLRAIALKFFLSEHRITENWAKDRHKSWKIKLKAFVQWLRTGILVHCFPEPSEPWVQRTEQPFGLKSCALPLA